MRSPHLPRAGAAPRVCRAWRVTDPAGIPPRRWIALAGAVAAWPGAPVVVERRWTTPARDALVAEHVVVSVDGAGVVAPADAVRRDADHLGRLLLAGVEHEPAHAEPALAAPIADVAELRRLPLREPPPAACESLAAALSALSVDCDRATLALAVASPALGTSELEEPAAGPRVRFRLRLTADRHLPVSAVAHAGALAGASAAEWVRPAGDADLHAARRAVAGPAAHLWGRATDAEADPATPAAVAGQMLALRVVAVALRRR